MSEDGQGIPDNKKAGLQLIKGGRGRVKATVETAEHFNHHLRELRDKETDIKRHCGEAAAFFFCSDALKEVKPGDLLDVREMIALERSGRALINTLRENGIHGEVRSMEGFCSTIGMMLQQAGISLVAKKDTKKGNNKLSEEDIFRLGKAFKAVSGMRDLLEKFDVDAEEELFRLPGFRIPLIADRKLVGKEINELRNVRVAADKIRNDIEAKHTITDETIGLGQALFALISAINSLPGMKEAKRSR